MHGYDRYAYGLNNPVKYTDPTGHKVCDYDCQVEYEGADPDYEHYCEGCEWDVAEQERNEGIAEVILGGPEFIARFFDPVDWVMTFDSCMQGQCSGWEVAFAMAPFVSGGMGKSASHLIGKYGDDLTSLVGKKGYFTFGGLKQYLGNPGKNFEWHHIVERSQANIWRSGFSPFKINNTNNIIAIDKGVHTKISAHYGSSLNGPGSGTIRDWLSGKSFQFQYEYGLDVLRDYGVIR